MTINAFMMRIFVLENDFFCNSQAIKKLILQHFIYFRRSDPFAYKRCSNQPHNNLYPPPPPVGFVYHHSSFDELSSAKSNRNLYYPNGNINFVVPTKSQLEYQWPKVIPKSPSSFSVNSFRLQRQPPFNKCPNYNPIDEFDLDKIEHDFRRSHTTLFNENVKKTDFGTAVWSVTRRRKWFAFREMCSSFVQCLSYEWGITSEIRAWM